ncbi:hypothetical protein ACFWYW_13645 [Nonomuraea sp. NPDC059023]
MALVAGGCTLAAAGVVFATSPPAPAPAPPPRCHLHEHLTP